MFGRSGWLGSVLSGRVVEDSVRLAGAEVGEELQDEAEEGKIFWTIPLAFNSPRHLQVLICTICPRSSYPFYIPCNLMYKMDNYFLDI